MVGINMGRIAVLTDLGHVANVIEADSIEVAEVITGERCVWALGSNPGDIFDDATGAFTTPEPQPLPDPVTEEEAAPAEEPIAAPAEDPAPATPKK